VSRIKAVLEEEHSMGLPYSRMMLMGFSQGAALSLFCGLQLSKSAVIIILFITIDSNQSLTNI
jgi:predicted esterase